MERYLRIDVLLYKKIRFKRVQQLKTEAMLLQTEKVLFSSRRNELLEEVVEGLLWLLY